MSVMSTYTGLVFDPMEMKEENVAIEDIAHALSMICRGGGQLLHFFTVAQHSINCSKEAEARGYSGRIQLACLLHDASEAYIADIIRPVKPHLNNYLEIEDSVMQVIWKKFGLGDLTEEEHALWRRIDNEILLPELKSLLIAGKDIELVPLALEPDLRERPYREVEAEFLERFRELN